MESRADRLSFFIPILILIILFIPSTAAAREFPDIQSTLTDIPDILMPIDEERILQMLDELESFSHLSGLVIITYSTEEWDFIEYGHDLFDHARSLGKLDDTGFLIYISVDDKKLAFVQGNDLERITDPEEIRALRNKAGEYLESEEYFNAIFHVLSRLRALSGPTDLDRARETRSDFLMLAGLMILIVVLLHNIRKRRISSNEEKEPGG